MNRRNFLKILGITPLALGSQFSYSKDDDLGYFLFVFLNGGADGLSMLAPYSDPLYKKYRKDTFLNSDSYIPITKDFAVNKILEKTYYDWYKEGFAHYYPLAGQENNSRSHFNCQDTIQLGTMNPASKTGLLTRLGELIPELKIISFTDNMPLALKGSNNKYPNISIDFIRNNYRFNKELANKYDGEYEPIYKNVLNNSKILSEYNREKVNNLGELGVAGSIMKDNGFNFGFIELLGWDTHANQKNNINNLLTNLNVQLLNFRNGMGDKWSKTTVFIMSEFGRTVYENGVGTDHGWGNLISVFDGSFKKSEVIGDWNGLSELHQNRELLVKNDYRDILFDTLKNKYNLNEADKDKIFT